MAELKYTPVPHDQKAFLAKARHEKASAKPITCWRWSIRLRAKYSKLDLAPVSPKTQS